MGGRRQRPRASDGFTVDRESRSGKRACGAPLRCSFPPGPSPGPIPMRFVFLVALLAVMPRHATSQCELQRVAGPGVAAGDLSGAAIATNSDLLVVGAPGADVGGMVDAGAADVLRARRGSLGPSSASRVAQSHARRELRGCRRDRGTLVRDWRAWRGIGERPTSTRPRRQPQRASSARSRAQASYHRRPGIASGARSRSTPTSSSARSWRTRAWSSTPALSGSSASPTTSSPSA